MKKKVKHATKRFWTAHQVALLRELYPHQPTATVAFRIKRSVQHCYAKATRLGLAKTPQFFADAKASGRFDKLTAAGRKYCYPKGHVPANKGLRRPGWSAGRMRDTQFVKGQLPHNSDPEFYVLGALRVNTDGYIEMRISFDAGARGWRPLHRILWEDAHGPVPPKHCLKFKNDDRLDVELDNLELITQRENMLRNTIHRLPPPLKKTIHLLGQLKRRIREKQDRRPA